MSQADEYVIGAEVKCQDGTCGELRRVVVDPVARALTHLVVEPKHGHSGGHLVPVELVEAATPATVSLACTISHFESLDNAEEVEFIPGAAGTWGYGQGQMMSLPYFGLGMGMGGLAGGMAGGPQAVTYEKVPLGQVQVRRGERVHATDGVIGRVQGLVIDPADHHVTHVLLDEGHLWGQKQVAVPIAAVTGVEEGVRLNLTKDQVKELPPVDIDHLS
ncbi:MAG: PRC-barrel domain-containing protein [Acidimicrobiales bacterium]